MIKAAPSPLSSLNRDRRQRVKQGRRQRPRPSAGVGSPPNPFETVDERAQRLGDGHGAVGLLVPVNEIFQQCDQGPSGRHSRAVEGVDEPGPAVFGIAPARPQAAAEARPATGVGSPPNPFETVDERAQRLGDGHGAVGLLVPVNEIFQQCDSGPFRTPLPSR